MAVFSHNHHLPLSVLFCLFLLTTARLNLDVSDHEAWSTVQKHLGIHDSFTTPCTKPGVFCERRITENNTYVLKITKLVFNSQQLHGFLNPAIGRLTELTEILLAHNELAGQVPSQIAECKKLEVLYLGNNKFSGDVPPGLSTLTRLRVLDLSSNRFTGNLSFLKDFPNLEKLSLADNLLAGEVPESIKSFHNLQVYDFSGNSFLEGPLPVMTKVESSRWSLYPKRHVLVEIEKTTKDNTSASGPVSSAMAPNQAGAASTNQDKNNGKLRAWAIGFSSGAAAGAISGSILSLLFKLILAAIKQAAKESGPAIFSPLIKKAKDLAFLEKYDGLASLEIIGKGGCGEVYRAELPGSGGKMIAIKKIAQPLKDAAELPEEDNKLLNKKMRQIRSEINTVGQIRHKNLLPLLAHVSRPDCHYLLYEFMKNGSLQDTLRRVSAGEIELDWKARYKIAVGVAAGVEYLHMSHNPRIIHRDLKPANILLDDNMEARITDFGLAKAMPDAKTHLTMSNVAGTVGYIAPEYHQTFKFTEKCDIYSFGVILGVLVIGKLPSDDFFQNTHEMSLVKWMRNIMTSAHPSKAIDLKLMGKGSEEQMLLVLKVACFCTLDDPKERPNSKDVVCMLAQIKHQSSKM